MRKQDIRPWKILASFSPKLHYGIHTRNIDKHYQLQKPSILLPNFSRRLNRLINQPALAADAQRVQHEEHIIPQPGYESRIIAAQGNNEKGVPDDFGDAPRDQHAGVGGGFG
jgi:hypothetical protein